MTDDELLERRLRWRSPLAGEFLDFARQWPWWKRLLRRRQFKAAEASFENRIVDELNAGKYDAEGRS